jgi:hypothetical protein
MLHRHADMHQHKLYLMGTPAVTLPAVEMCWLSVLLQVLPTKLLLWLAAGR